MGNVAVAPIRVLAATGLKREALIVAGPEVTVVAGGGDAERLARELRRLAGQADGLISIGIAGALDPSLRVGDAVIGTGVSWHGETRATNPAWTTALTKALPHAQLALVSGRTAIAADAETKAMIRLRDGSAAVDMESHVVAQIAAEHGLPFTVLRFISDNAARGLPKAALVGMRADGGIDLAAVIRSVLADPRQIPALVRTGWEAEAAFGALVRDRRRLGPALGFADVQGVQLA